MEKFFSLLVSFFFQEDRNPLFSKVAKLIILFLPALLIYTVWHGSESYGRIAWCVYPPCILCGLAVVNRNAPLKECAVAFIIACLFMCFLVFVISPSDSDVPEDTGGDPLPAMILILGLIAWGIVSFIGGKEKPKNEEIQKE